MGCVRTSLRAFISISAPPYAPRLPWKTESGLKVMLPDPIHPGANPKGKVPKEVKSLPPTPTRFIPGPWIVNPRLSPLPSFGEISIETCADDGIGNAVCRCSCAGDHYERENEPWEPLHSYSSVRSAKGVGLAVSYVTDSIKSSMFCVFALPMNA